MQPPTTLDIRQLREHDEYQQALELQRAVWGFVDLEVVPVHVLLTANTHGGLALGAFEAKEMAGLLFGFPGLTPDGTLVHCSHILGVHPDKRNRGIGADLKWEQRRRVLAQGIDLIQWTYDPLEVGNARLNLHHLCAICRRYHVDLYGDIVDRLNRGLPSDRFEVEWHLRDASVEALAMGTRRAMPASGGEDILSCRWHGEKHLRPLAWHKPSEDSALVEVPSDFQALKQEDHALALEWRYVTREVFSWCFSHGFVATDVVIRMHGERQRWMYLLRRG